MTQFLALVGGLLKHNRRYKESTRDQFGSPYVSIHERLRIEKQIHGAHSCHVFAMNKKWGWILLPFFAPTLSVLFHLSNQWPLSFSKFQVGPLVLCP